MTDQYACLGAEDKTVCQEQHADEARSFERTWKASTPHAQKHNTAEQMPGAVRARRGEGSKESRE